MSRAQIIHNFGRAEDVDKDGLKRLIRSIARELDPADEAAVLAGRDVTVLEFRDLGGVWVLDQLWRRLKIDTAIRTVARGRRVDIDAVERVLFALVAGRALAPSSKLEACRWISQEVHISGLEQTDADTCYRAMDFLLDALDELQESVFFTVADLLQLDVDVLFLDTTSTYFELELGDDERHHDDDGDDDGEDGGVPLRVRGHSKDHRGDLPQVVIGMAVTRGGIPVRLWSGRATPPTRPWWSRSRMIWRGGS
jgi:hypothetical protein